MLATYDVQEDTQLFNISQKLTYMVLKRGEEYQKGNTLFLKTDSYTHVNNLIYIEEKLNESVYMKLKQTD